MHCGGRWIGSSPMDMSKPVAIVAAISRELGPLLRGASKRQVDGVELYELPSALVATGGMGRDAGTRAAEVVVREASPAIVVSAGLAGALTPSQTWRRCIRTGGHRRGDRRTISNGRWGCGSGDGFAGGWG